MLVSCARESKTARAVPHDPALSILWNLNHKRLGRSNVSIASDIYALSLPGWQKHTAESFGRDRKE